MKKLVITGANGVGKSHFASQLSLARPEIAVISFDAIKLQRNWQMRSQAEIDAALRTELEKEAWIIEGGPSLMSRAVEKADALVWLDPPEYVRAWQLASRPWRHIGKTRPELPPGNVDWPMRQYSFALRSLMKGVKFRAYISEAFSAVENIQKWRCRNEIDRKVFVAKWANASE